MNCPLKTVWLVVASFSVITMPIVSLAAPERGSLGASHLRSSHSASSGQSSGAPQFSRSSPANSFNLGSANGLGRRVEHPGRLQVNAVQPLPQLVPNVRLNRAPRNPATTQINRDAIRRSDPPVITSRPAEIKPNSLGQAHFPAGISTVDGKLGAGAQSLVKNLAKKDEILKLKKDFLANQEKIGLGDLPKL